MLYICVVSLEFISIFFHCFHFLFLFFLQIISHFSVFLTIFHRIQKIEDSNYIFLIIQYSQAQKMSFNYIVLLFLIITLSLQQCDINGDKNSCLNEAEASKATNIQPDSAFQLPTEQNQVRSSFASFISQLHVESEVDSLIGFQEEETDGQGHLLHPADRTNLKRVLKNNKRWIKQKTKADPSFFKKHSQTQKPNYLWIGCSDSRLPANQILGLDYGQVFVLRNVANLVSPSDISSLAVIQYAVEVLQVKDIIVAGHYGCGGVKAAVTKYNHGPLEAWLSKLRRIRHKHSHAFAHLTTIDEKAKLLVEINVKEQVFNVASTSFVQQAWKSGQQLRVHGVVFEMQSGRLIDLKLTMHSIEQLPQQLAVVQK